MNDQPTEAVTECFYLDALVRGDPGDLTENDGEQHDSLVQHLIACEVAQQRAWHSVRIACHEHCRSGHTWHRMLSQGLEERFDRGSGLPLHRHRNFPAAVPCRHHREDDRPEREREPAAFYDL